MKGTPDPASEAVLTPLGAPPTLPRRRGHELTTGLQLDPVRRIAAFSPEDLENLVEYWLREKVEGHYAEVIRYAGPGDKGRDVVGYVNADRVGDWDNYQCKHYGEKLRPADLWPELGKLVYWTKEGSFSAPRRYRFVAPKGATAKVLELLDDPDKLRRELKKNWKKHCKTLCDFEEIEKHLASFTFPKLKVVSGGEIVADLKGMSIYPVFFGGGLSKPRPPVKPPPTAIGSDELGYVNALVDAYDEHCEEGIASPEAAISHQSYGPHLRTSRKEFYCAESLREFSKDVLVEPGSFNELQNQVHDGIQHRLAEDFPSGFDRALAVCAHATSIQLSDHPLSDDLEPADRAGICHQLANDGRVAWRRP
jgi:hypothetical protein